MRLKFLLLIILCFGVPSIYGQGVRQGPDPATMRDPDLERDSYHNLEVAKNYFKLKKAYVAALKRCEEIIAGNPNFAKIDEVLLMAGQSSLWLADNKGKQLRFSHDGIEFFNTGAKLAAQPKAETAASKSKAKSKAAKLPSQADVLK